jgi:hypothetical protein
MGHPGECVVVYLGGPMAQLSAILGCVRLRSRRVPRTEIRRRFESAWKKAKFPVLSLVSASLLLACELPKEPRQRICIDIHGPHVMPIKININGTMVDLLVNDSEFSDGDTCIYLMRDLGPKVDSVSIVTPTARMDTVLVGGKDYDIFIMKNSRYVTGSNLIDSTAHDDYIRIKESASGEEKL